MSSLHLEKLKNRLGELASKAASAQDRETARELAGLVANVEAELAGLQFKYERTNKDKQIANTLLHHTSQDLTKALQATEIEILKLKKAEETNRRLMVAIDQAAESILFTDTKGTILYVNQGFERASGYDRHLVLGKNPRILKSGKHSEAFYKELWGTISRGAVWHGRITNRRRNGEFFEEEVNITPIFNDDNQIVSYVALKRDITREVTLERQFIEAQKMEAIGQLAGGVAHDYNNILAATMLQLSLLLEEPDLAPLMREGLESIQEGAQRAANLTRQLLTFSRRQVIQKKPLDLNALLDDELKMLRRILGEHISLVRVPPPGPAWIEADSGMIQQVVMNLCINARDAMPKGGQLLLETKQLKVVDASTRPSIDARSGAFICLSVVDSGCGMSKETKQKIFEPFFTTKEVGKGTGLGLATVYGIVKQHNGWIEVSSEPGKGSEFLIFIPASAEANSSQESEPGSQGLGGAETILLVEDGDAVREVVASSLSSKGYRILTASNGSEALAIWEQNGSEIRLLLTDMVMPGGMTGLELAEGCKRLRPSLPVIIMSGYSDESAQSVALNRPGYAYLAKPCTATELAAAVRKALDGGQSGNDVPSLS